MTAREVIATVQGFIGDPDGQDWTRAKVLPILNQQLKALTAKSNCIHEAQYRPLIADEYQYALTPGFLRLYKAKVYWGDWHDLTRGAFGPTEIAASNPGGGPPSTYTVWQNARIEKFVGTVYAVDNDASRARDLIRQLTVPVPVDDSTLKIGDLVINLSDHLAQGTITQFFTDTPIFPATFINLHIPRLSAVNLIDLMWTTRSGLSAHTQRGVPCW